VEVALQLAERLLAAVAVIGIDHSGRRLTIGACVGLVEVVGDPDATCDGAFWLALADGACYEAKRAGRNAVRVAKPAISPDAPAGAKGRVSTSDRRVAA